MRFMVSVLDDATATATDAEVRAIDAFNDGLRADGHWVLAAGLADPDTASVVDGRGAEVEVTAGPWIRSAEYVSGLWIIEAADEGEALRLAEAGSRACHRRVEVRAFLGG